MLARQFAGRVADFFTKLAALHAVAERDKWPVLAADRWICRDFRCSGAAAILSKLFRKKLE